MKFAGCTKKFRKTKGVKLLIILFVALTWSNLRRKDFR